MRRDFWKTSIVALTAVLLTLIVLTFVERNPWMLMGVAAILWAIAAIVRAINSTTGREDSIPQGPQNASAKPRKSAQRRSCQAKRSSRTRRR